MKSVNSLQSHEFICEEKLTIEILNKWRNKRKMIKEILDSNLASNLVPAIIALVGVIVSLKWSTGETTKRMEQALKVYESELNRKVYVSSKRADIEFEIFQKLGKNCGEILQLMQRLYPDKLSTHQINYSEKPDLNDLALKIRDLELEINNSRAFISGEIILIYTELSKNAESFFADAEKHNLCWDDSKEDHIRKTELRDIAYKSRIKFEENWIKASEHVKKYLRAEE